MISGNRQKRWSTSRRWADAPRAGVVRLRAYRIKTARAESIAPDVRAVVREVAPEARCIASSPLPAWLSTRCPLSFTMLTLGILCFDAGAHTVRSASMRALYVVAQRTREIRRADGPGPEAGGFAGWSWRREPGGADRCRHRRGSGVARLECWIALFVWVPAM